MSGPVCHLWVHPGCLGSGQQQGRDPWPEKPGCPIWPFIKSCPAGGSPLGQLGLRELPTCSEKLCVAVGQVLTSPCCNVGSVPAGCPQPVSPKLLHSGAFSSTAVVSNNYFKEKSFLHFKKFLGVCSYKFHLSYQRTI